MNYYSSDWHLGHTNIVGPKVSKWSSGYRDFDSLHEMNKTIINNVNKTVGPDDTLYFLGDLTLNRKPKKWLDMVVCKNIHFIYGNHDKISTMKSLPKGYLLSQQDYKEIYVEEKTKVCMFHYAQRVWNKSHHGSWHLYGHSHNSLPKGWGKSMDVGIDSAYELLGEYRPFSHTEVYKILESPNTFVKEVDHHITRDKR